MMLKKDLCDRSHINSFNIIQKVVIYELQLDEIIDKVYKRDIFKRD